MFIKEKDCCGCGVCENVCKFDALHMKMKENGFLYPVLDPEKCVNCKACETHCPIVVRDKTTNSNHNLENYAVYLKDRSELLQSASGGAAAALAKTVLKNGGTVFGVAYADGYRKSKTIRVTSMEELSLIRDSKYMQSEKGNIYQEVREDLERGRRVLYTGTPCEIGAVKAFLGKEYDNLYTCEIICHGPTTCMVAEKFLQEQERKWKSRVVQMSVRSKVNGWRVPHIQVVFENGKSLVQEFYSSDYGIGFSVLMRESCYQCKYKGNRKVADITVGDFWGADEKDPYWNPDGISAVNIHTERGRELLQMTRELKKFPVSYETILKGNSFLEKSVDDNRAAGLFQKCFRKTGLHFTVTLYIIYRRMVQIVKQMSGRISSRKI